MSNPISKETNIAFAIMYVCQHIATWTKAPELWGFLFLLPISYVVFYILLNRYVKKLKKEREIRNNEMMDGFIHWDDGTNHPL